MKNYILILTCITILIPSAKSQDNSEFKVREQKTTKSDTKKVKENKKETESDENAFDARKIVITIGYGFPNLNTSVFKGHVVNANSINDRYGDNTYAYSVSGFGPAFLKVDYGVTKFLGLGISAGYSKVSLNESETYRYSVLNSVTGLYETNTYIDETKYENTKISVAARINFHFGTGEKLDPYAGIAMGYSFNQLKLTYNTNNPTGPTPANYTSPGFPFHFAITVGMRYYFTKNIGIYGELGLDKWSLIQGGLAIKI